MTGFELWTSGVGATEPQPNPTMSFPLSLSITVTYTLIFLSLSNTHTHITSVTRKNRQMSIKVAQKCFTRKMVDFDTFTKIA